MANLAVIQNQFFDSSGVPLSGGKVFTYAAGTTTLKTTYTDATGITPNTNPIILNSRGEAQIWMSDSLYKIVLTDSVGSVIYTQDNISPLSSVGIGYQPSGTGAVPTTVQAKLRESVSVFDFMTASQVIDVTSRTASIDLSAAIQNAASSLTNGGVLRFPMGKYYIASVIDFTDMTTVQGDGMDSTYILSVSSNTTSLFRSNGGTAATPSRRSFGVRDLTIDMSYTMDRTSTATTGAYPNQTFNQWQGHAQPCISSIGVYFTSVQNVRTLNAGVGLSASALGQVDVDGFRAEGMQWDGIALYGSVTESTQSSLVSLKNIWIKGVGRDGVFSSYVNGEITLDGFYIADAWINAIELESVNTSKHCDIINGYITDCGAIGGATSYGTNTYGTMRNVYCSSPKIHAGFGNRTSGEADQYYNLSSGGGWTGTASFPVPNVAGTWPNCRYGGIEMEGAFSLIDGCTFVNMSGTAVSPFSYAYRQPNSTTSPFTISNCSFVNSNVYTSGGEQHNLSNNYFTTSTLILGQSSASFNQNPTTTIAGNQFISCTNPLFMQDNALVIGNEFYNTVGTAIIFNPSGAAGSDGKTIISNNNIIDARGVSSTMTFGIDSANNASLTLNLVIEDNYIFGATTVGIEHYGQSISNGTIIKNNIIDTCAIGLELARDYNSIVSGNIMRRNTTCDINLYGNAAGATWGAPTATNLAYGTRIIGNLLQSGVPIRGQNYTAPASYMRVANNEYVVANLSPANVLSLSGTNIISGNWS